MEIENWQDLGKDLQTIKQEVLSNKSKWHTVGKVELRQQNHIITVVYVTMILQIFAKWT